MSGGLFRDEVTRARQQAWLGTVGLDVPRMGWAMAALAVVAVLAIAAFLVWGTHHRSVRVEGVLSPVSGLQRVQAPSAGTVARRLVDEGQTVRAGDPLLEISVDLATPDNALPVAARVARGLSAERERLQEALAVLDALGPERDDALQLRVDTLAEELASAREAERLRERQAANAQEMLERLHPLREGRIISEVQIQQYEDQALDAQAALGDARRAAAQAQRDLAEARQRRTERGLGIDEERGALASELSAVERDLAEIQVRRTLVLRAARDGRVDNLGVDVGETIEAGRQVLSIVPEDAVFRAELWVPASAVAALAEGHRVAMRYDAFPHGHYGPQYGRIETVARSAVPADEVRARTGIAANGSLYRVAVVLDHQRVRGAEGGGRLQADMRLDADLMLERQPLYRLLFGRDERGLRGAEPAR